MATMGVVDAEANIATMGAGVVLEGVEIMAIMGVALVGAVIMAIMGVALEGVEIMATMGVIMGVMGVIMVGADAEVEDAASVMEEEATMVVTMGVAGVAIVVTITPEVATKIRIPVWMIFSVESELALKIHPRKVIVLLFLMHETLMGQKKS